MITLAGWIWLFLMIFPLVLLDNLFSISLGSFRRFPQCPVWELGWLCCFIFCLSSCFVVNVGSYDLTFDVHPFSEDFMMDLGVSIESPSTTEKLSFSNCFLYTRGFLEFATHLPVTQIFIDSLDSLLFALCPFTSSLLARGLCRAPLWISNSQIYLLPLQLSSWYTNQIPVQIRSCGQSLSVSCRICYFYWQPKSHRGLLPLLPVNIAPSSGKSDFPPLAH